MRAIQIREFGGPEVLQHTELPVPEPGSGQLLIEVRRAGVNLADTHQRTDHRDLAARRTTGKLVIEPSS